jgi:hypothetical protein
VGVKQQPHLRQRPQKKILGERIIEIIRDEAIAPNDPAGLEKGFTGFKIQSASLSMRHEIEDRPAVSGDDDNLPLFHFTGKFRQAILRISD